MSDNTSPNNASTNEKQNCSLNKQQVIVLWLTLGFSIVSLFISIILQFHFISADQVAKAKAGSVKDQYFLADHYYEIGDNKESIYWYKIASMDSGLLGAYAKNNLAVLYIQTGIANNTDQYMRGRVLRLFEHAAEAKLDDAAKNMYAYLLQTPEDSFDSEEYVAKLTRAKELLTENKVPDTEMSELNVKWSYIGTESGSYVPADTETRSYVVQSADYIYDTDLSFQCHYVYTIYERSEDSSVLSYIYAHYE